MLWHTLVSMEPGQPGWIKRALPGLSPPVNSQDKLGLDLVLAGKCASSIDSRWCPLHLAEMFLIKWRSVRGWGLLRGEDHWLETL